MDLGDPARDVRAVFQPVVELDTGRVVGLEALARGVAGSALESPRALFAAAADLGRRAELDVACRRAAFSEAAAAQVPGSVAVFVNVEADLIGDAVSVPQAAVWRRGLARGPVVAEFTERALVEDPAGLLAGVERLRRLGCRIALDDVGSDPRALALLPFARPDVIKLDLALVAGRTSDAVAETVHAVLAEVERSGALVVAEGIETDEDLQLALALGANHGQGWHFGRPGPPRVEGEPGLLPAPVTSQLTDARTPFELLSGQGVAVRVLPKKLVFSITRRLELQAARLGAHGALLAAFEHRRYFSRAAAERYAAIARDAALVAVFAEGIDTRPAPGVRGQPLREHEPLRRSWDVTVVGPHVATALVTHDLGDTDVPDGERRFQVATTFDRDLAVGAARLLLERVRPHREVAVSPP